MTAVSPAMTTTAGSGLRVEVIDSLEALQRHAPAYDALTDRVDGTLFPAFRRHWIEAGRSIYLAQPGTLLFLFAWRGNSLVGVAPFPRERRSIGVGEVVWLSFWGQHTGVPQLDSLTGDFLIPDPADARHCITAFRDCLTGSLRNRWDYLNLQYFCTTSPNLEIFLDAFPESSRELDEMSGYRMELPSNPQAIVPIFSGQTRKSLRKAARLLAESGRPYRFEASTMLDTALFDEIAQVHTSRQNALTSAGRIGRNALLADATTRRALLGMLMAMSGQGRLRVHTLRIEGRLAAFALMLSGGSSAVCWLTAFESDFHEFSPVRLVFEKAYQSEVENWDTRCIDLLLGYTRTKKEMTTREYQAFRCTVVNDWSGASQLRRWLYRQGKAAWSSLRRTRRSRAASATDSPHNRSQDAGDATHGS